MNLVIFDIDGTLTATSRIDEQCYAQAFAKRFDIEIRPADYEHFTHFTDSGIMRQLFQQRMGRVPTVREIKQVQAEFIALLRASYARDAQEFEAVAGAAETIAQLRNERNWQIALATGCWKASAELKLQYAQIDCSGLPLAHSDLLLSRSEIVTEAIRQAKELFKAGFEHITFVGDGIWDVRTAQELGLGFIGIQHENYHSPLALEAPVVISGYENYDAFLQHLEKSAV